MAKSTVKVQGNTISGSAEDIINVLNKATEKMNGQVPGIEIKAATLKDGFCNYSYEMTEGVTAGDAVKRSGAAMVHDDMRIAFAKLNVHLGVICEEIAPIDIDIDNLPDFMDEELKGKEKKLADRINSFTVASFRVDGTGENEGVVLSGTKRLSTGDLLKLETPKVKWSEHYEFVQELMGVITQCKNEVQEYMNGKAAPKMVQQDLDFDSDTDRPE